MVGRFVVLGVVVVVVVVVVLWLVQALVILMFENFSDFHSSRCWLVVVGIALLLLCCHNRYLHGVVDVVLLLVVLFYCYCCVWHVVGVCVRLLLVCWRLFILFCCFVGVGCLFGREIKTTRMNISGKT